jgi:hypothetical protein
VPYQIGSPRHAKLCPVIASHDRTLASKLIELINANEI